MELGSDGRQVLAIAFPPAAQDLADALLDRRQAAIVPVLWQMLHSLLRFHLDQSLVLPGGPPVQARIAPESATTASRSGVARRLRPVKAPEVFYQILVGGSNHGEQCRGPKSP
jgi:hypothetical protein